MLLTVLSALLLTQLIQEGGSQTTDCFELDGANDSYVMFVKDSRFSYNYEFHFRLEFKTSADNEVIYYNEGQYVKDGILDYEGVFIRNGFVEYLGFNPSPYGAGESFGSYAKSNFTVNNDTWFQLEFFRNNRRKIQYNGEEEMAIVTGMVINGRQFLSMGRERQEMDLGPHLWVGGHDSISRISQTLSCFSGRIKYFSDVTNELAINEPVEHVGRYATFPCDAPPPPA